MAKAGDVNIKITSNGHSYCRCAYNWLDDNLTNDEFYDTTQKALKGDIPSIMYEAARACKNYN